MSSGPLPRPPGPPRAPAPGSAPPPPLQPSPSSPPAQPLRDRQITAALITAAATVIVGVIGVVATQTGALVAAISPPAARTTVVTLGPPSSSEPPASTGPGVQTTAPPLGTPPVADPSIPDEGTLPPVGSTVDPYVYHQGSVTVRAGVWIDLDAAADDPGWRPIPDPLGLSEPVGDVGWTGRTLSPGRNVLAGAVTTTDAGACALQLGYGARALTLEQLSPGSAVCVMTDQGRVSLLVVDRASSAALSLTITTRKRNTDFW